MELFVTGTPFWKLVLKQFDDLLVKILIVAAIVSFLLALVNGETGLSAFVEPTVSLSWQLYTLFIQRNYTEQIDAIGF